MIENIRLSFQGIWAHKMRSFLTMLGIIIGIAAIIAIVSTIKGTSEQIKQNLVGSGDNIVNVQLYEGEMQYYSSQWTQTPEGVALVTDDIKEQILDIEEVSAVSAFRFGSIESICYGDTVLNGLTLTGVDNSYFDVLGYAVTKGRLFTQNDIDSFKKFVVLDVTAADNLFAGENPIGKTVEMSGNAFIVIGVVDQLNKFTPHIENIMEYYTYYSDMGSGKIFVSEAVWPMIFKFDEPYNVVVKATSTENMTNAGRKTSEILNSYITVPEGMEESNYKYKSEDLLETAKALQDVSASTSKQLIWIASISLLVGGIGVMNIMLVSVTERTREIGLKKALGARKSVILSQFLTEAAVLTSIGGLVGVGAGIGLAYLISNITEAPVAISGAAIAISVLFSMIIGIVFGLLPSIKAARLNPIDALRYE